MRPACERAGTSDWVIALRLVGRWDIEYVGGDLFGDIFREINVMETSVQPVRI